MKFGCQIVFVGICLAIISCGIASAINSSREQSQQSSPGVTAQESQDQDSSAEMNSESLLEHESNGPEGAEGVPMQRASIMQTTSAVIVLLLAAGLALSQKEDRANKDN